MAAVTPGGDESPGDRMVTIRWTDEATIPESFVRRRAADTPDRGEDR